MPFDSAILKAGVNVALADKLVQSGELSVGAAAKLAAMPYGQYLKHLGGLGISMFGKGNFDDELLLLTENAQRKSGAKSEASAKVPKIHAKG